MSKKKNILIEPVTGTRYASNEWPPYALGPVSSYKMLEEFSPPATWGALGTIEEFRSDDRWDPFFRSVFMPEYINNIIHKPDHPVDMRAQAYIMAKSYARRGGYHEHGNSRIAFFAQWARVEPTWYFLGEQQSFKLITVERYNMMVAKEATDGPVNWKE